MYPYVALQDLPGTQCHKVNQKIRKSENQKIRSKDSLTFPLGKWEGWYYSEELKFAEQNGYKIEVIKGYSFNRSKDVFKDFVKNVYSIKTNPKDNTQKQTVKSILNNLMGRFGKCLTYENKKIRK